MSIDTADELLTQLAHSPEWQRIMADIQTDLRARKAAKQRKGYAAKVVKRHSGIVVLRLKRLTAPSYELALKHANGSGLHVAVDRDELIYWRLPVGAKYTPPDEDVTVTLDERINSRA